MSIHHKAAWTLHGQLRFIIITSTLAILILGGLSVWRIQQFNRREVSLRHSAELLQRDLQTNFDITRLLGEIDNHLRVYMDSGNKEALNRLVINLDQLKLALSHGNLRQLRSFEDKLRTLQIRMASLKENDEKIYSVERRIAKATDTLLHSAGPAFFFPIQTLVMGTCMTHHHLYNTTIQTSEPGNLERATLEYNEMFDKLESALKKLKQEVPDQAKPHVTRLQQSFYELDETVSTINAIREVTLSTKLDLLQMLATIKADIATASIAQAQQSAQGMNSVLTLAKTNLMIMSVGLVISALMLTLIAFFLNQSMVKPLLAFSRLLRKMTRILTGLRKESEFEEEFTELLTSITQDRQDEIGEVAKAIEQLLERLRRLALFRQAVEGDETRLEIYQRLGRTFSHRIGLTDFVIYEVSDDNDQEMVPALVQISADIDLPEKTLSRECRAWRNRGVISSLDDSRTCRFFPSPRTLCHVCVPMQVSDQLIGIVQFLFPAEEKNRNQQQTNTLLIEARHYIAEALPVLHAKRLAERLQAMATEDSLTGLYNRHYLDANLPRLVAGIRRRKSTICILMCDIDHFKQINDSHGHDAGDKVLNQLARIFLNTIRDTDLAIRFGGEEFMILLVDCDPTLSRDMAERIRSTVEKTRFHIPGHTVRITLSIGLTIFPTSPDQTIWDAIKMADIALYQAKTRGRNQVAVLPEEQTEPGN